MINGILAERTVSDVLPALQTNADGLKKVLDDLVKQYQSKQTDLEKWKVGLRSHIQNMLCADDKVEKEQHPSRSAIGAAPSSPVPEAEHYTQDLPHSSRHEHTVFSQLLVL